METVKDSAMSLTKLKDEAKLAKLCIWVSSILIYLFYWKMFWSSFSNLKVAIMSKGSCKGLSFL